MFDKLRRFVSDERARHAARFSAATSPVTPGSGASAVAQQHTPVDALPPPSHPESGLVAAQWDAHCASLISSRAAEWRAGSTDFTASMTRDGATMRFRARTVGARPPGGYPLYICLHGGGGCPRAMNDGQWADMQRYWLGAVECGVYVAPRGVSNSWKLHWEDPSFGLYDRLVENAVALGGADPNRVYLMGYSAGGDGVYRVVPVLPDRFAAANMSAGHPNGVSVDNMQHVPMLLQVGERDAAYDRNKVTAEYGAKLVAAGAAQGDGYRSDVWVHRACDHSGIHDHGQNTTLVQDANAWLRGSCGAPGGTVQVRCDSVAWLSRWVRDPTPRTLVWAVEPQPAPPAPPLRRKSVQGGAVSLARVHYWLDLTGAPAGCDVGQRVEADVNREANLVVVRRCGDWLRVLMNSQLVDLERRICVKVERQGERPSAVFKGLRARVRKEVSMRTLELRSDPGLVFVDELVVRWYGKEGEERWQVVIDDDVVNAGAQE